MKKCNYKIKDNKYLYLMAAIIIFFIIIILMINSFVKDKIREDNHAILKKTIPIFNANEYSKDIKFSFINEMKVLKNTIYTLNVEERKVEESESELIRELEKDNKNKSDNKVNKDNKKIVDNKKDYVDVFRYGTEEEKEIIINKLYVFEKNTKLPVNNIQLGDMIMKKMNYDLKNNKPKILIFHTHSQEAFIDSRKGNKEDTVVGLGNRLVKILEEKYGIKALHHVGEYDVVDGILNRGGSYSRATKAIKKILDENKDIEIVIDIHRDGLPNGMRVITNLNGKKTAKIMFVNGICGKVEGDSIVPIGNLKNKYINENLAFSLKMEIESKKIFNNFTRKILIKPYRYSLYMRPKSLLVEVGAQTNTVQEAMNAMEPFADILMNVLNEK